MKKVLFWDFDGTLIYSNTSFRDSMCVALRKLGYSDISNVGFEKPRKEIFDYARKVSGNPDVCYMIGDNPVADVEGATEAGMKAVLVHATRVVQPCVGCAVCRELKDVVKVLQ